LHVRRLFFYLGISKPLSLRICLILPHMLGRDIVSFPYSMSLFFFFSVLIFFNIIKKIKNKKIGGEDAEFFFFFFYSFLDIVCIFA
jgi:hypothetical protein